MKRLLLFLTAFSAISQTLVQFTPPVASSSTVTGSVVAVPFVMPCGASSYTDYGDNVRGNKSDFLLCAANYPTNSTLASQINGAADWIKITGWSGNHISLRKMGGMHRISDITILPSSSQAAIDALQLGYYVLPAYQTEDYDNNNPALPQTLYGQPYFIYTVGHYINCYNSGALVANCGESMTVPVAPRVMQTFYFAVGAVGKINGTFTVQLSDGTAPYIYTDTDAATGTATSNGTQTEKFFTVRMQASALGVTATVSYIGANLASGATSGSLGFIAAGIGGQTSGAVNPITQLPQVVNPGIGPGVYGAQIISPDSSVIPTTNRTVTNVAHVNDATDAAAYQTALDNAAAAGGNQLILLADGFQTSSIITIHNPPGRDNSWITTQCAVLPQKPGGGDVTYGQRPNPTNTDGSPVDTFHCHLLSNSNGDDALVNDNNSLTIARRTAHHYAFIGLEFGFPPASANSPMYSLIAISPLSNYNVEPLQGITAADYPHHIIFERCWIHGYIQTGTIANTGSEAGIVMNGNYFSLYDSYTNWFLKQGREAKAAWLSATTGPVTIRNTHIESDTEGFICCNQSQPTLGHVDAMNLDFEWNYFTKNRAEMPVATLEKNHLETKGSIAVTSSNNVFENSWSNSQNGQCIALNTHVGTPVADFKIGLANILIEKNYCKSGQGITLNPSEELNVGRPIVATQSNLGNHIMIRNNYFYISGTQATPGQNVSTHNCIAFGGGDIGVDTTLDHNTCEFDPADDSAANLESYSLGPGESSRLSGNPGQLARRGTFHFTNNDMPRQPTGSATSHYGLMPPGIDMTNNNLGRPNQISFTNSTGPYVGLATTQRGHDDGSSFYWAMIPTNMTGVGGFAGLGNPRNILNLGTNYYEGCKLDVFASSNGATCTPPPAMTYPNPVRGADKSLIFPNYCLIKWGNRPDLVASQGCVNPTY